MDPFRCLLAAIIKRAQKDAQRGDADARDFLTSESIALAQSVDSKETENTKGKICSDCGKRKPLQAFVGVYQAECKTCDTCRAADREHKRRARLSANAEGEAHSTSGERVRAWGLWLRPARRRPRDLPGQVWLEVM